MEKKKYIVLLLQIAAVAAAGVIGGDTLFALVDGVVRFERVGRDKKQVSVYAKEN